mmetsp:Transcript_5555/g.5738  ORF Transcript_5555/g.5738 Transcript_5555/m.5738 type:complete len:1029 (+) Transcript_5555:142-3228(+)|eukprot:CAMPEP_0182426270 /NCGR_PEP_ID=MMETSP1167-20130531/12767_1 /TAXON_ID=2988 /ORGANISM="Mallomonas Sp, Strain CCMP3275" /LENGTH=1028 /DNA_ID=CAMNT_0024607595 /DNA_START=140 /DNA_END=3226 /DNA_ORIENTATION=-
MASIKVAIRCRPFTIDDNLGVSMFQNNDEEGEVMLLNSTYSTSRFPFTYAWWSAYGYKRHCQGDNNMAEADRMVLINQTAVYDSCGQKIRADLMGGNAVVLFAYGLSGSGKTFTVFGPDATDAPEAWFKWSIPHDLWGIFPRLAFEVFKDKKDGWKISMKYFQNVVDIVRDLMSPNGEEQHYKSGMKMDADGFMDINWCSQRVIASWNDLRDQFQIANARKAIAPTQFNPMSTRGHCIMVLEVEMPSDMEGMKQRGRVYVCDLAGTEPAGDIVYAVYSKISFDDGSFEYKFKGAHPDAAKTKELQDQGKKINLSLSEMAQFFMKMAEAFQKKKLKPGASIPGCNSYFLCKYLKDTMLQAKTYLFCAIRPEVEFHRYTFATLGFAKNASVVKLAPKKAGAVAATEMEKKLMAELDAMKQLVESLKTQPAPSGRATPDDASAAMIAELQAKLSSKQNDLARELGGEGKGDGDADNKQEQQRQEYAKRGISLAALDHDTTDPYFINLDIDPFRSNRFMYIVNKENTVFGPKGDIQLTSLTVVKDHCKVRFDGTDAFLIAGKGDTWRNGHRIPENIEEKLNVFDRIAMGDQLVLYRWNGHEPENEQPMTADDAVSEFQEARANRRNSIQDGSMNISEEALKAQGQIEEERKRILEERERWEKEKTQIKSQRDEEQYQRAMASVDNQILDLLPKTKEAKQIVDLFNRCGMAFDVVLEKGAEHVPHVKVSITNTNPKHDILLDPTDFLPKLSLLKDEMMKLKSAIESSREYTLPERHDPLYLFFDNDFLQGSATHWPEYLLYNMETEADERMQEIKNSAVPYNTVGLLDVYWTPLAGPNEEDEKKPVPDIDSEDDLLGKSWTYKLEIKRASDLPVFCETAYIMYDFFGETFTTENVQQQTYSPVFDYVKVHHIDRVTPEFIQFLKGSIEMFVHLTPHVAATPDRIGTNNPIVVESVTTGEPLGYNTDPSKLSRINPSASNGTLVTEVETLRQENATLKARVKELEARLAVIPKSSPRASLKNAQTIDNVVNGTQ